MKRLIVAAMIAGSMMAMAEDAAKPAEAAKPAAVAAPARKQITAEQRAAMRAAARKAEMQKKALEIIKKYGLDDEKAKALLDELEGAMRPSRRPRPYMMKRPPKAAKPAAAPAKAE